MSASPVSETGDYALAVRNRIRAEANRLEAIARTETKRGEQHQRKHIIDGCLVAAQSLRKLAREMAAESGRDEMLRVTDPDANEEEN